MKQPGRRYLEAGELEHWSAAERRIFWAPDSELIESEPELRLVVDLPLCGADDVHIALMPRAIIVRKTVRVLASRSWKEVWNALAGPKALFRRFDLPASIDVNRVRAELEMGVLTVIAPKQAVRGETPPVGLERPAKGAPDPQHAFAA